MKKKIITASFIIATALFTSISAYAVVRTIQKDVVLGDNMSGRVYGELLNEDDVNVIKFIDGDITCYAAATKVDGNTVNTSISCLK